MTLQRVLLGPAIGDREYGLIATSAGLALNQRQAGTLSAYIFGARRSIRDVVERYYAFLPLDARNEPLWALCLTEVRLMGDSWVVFADAIILSEVDLNLIDWAVHRVALAWPERPAVAARAVPAFQFNTALLRADLTSVAPRAGLSLPFRIDFNRPGARIAAQVKDGLAPNYALASLWEALPPTVRYRRTFVSNPALEWTPVNRTDADFDLIVGPDGWTTGGPAVRTVTFGREGLVLPPDQVRPWHRTYLALEGALAGSDALNRRPGALEEPSPLETQPTVAYTTLLRQYQDPSGSPFATLAAASALVAANGPLLAEIDAAQTPLVRAAIEAEFVFLLKEADTMGRIRGIQLFAREIGPRLERYDRLTVLDWAIQTKVFFGLAADVALDLLGAVLNPQGGAMLSRLAALFGSPDIVVGPAVEATTTAVNQALRTAPTRQVAELATALLRRLGADPVATVEAKAFQSLGWAIAKYDGYKTFTRLIDEWKLVAGSDQGRSAFVRRRLSVAWVLLKGDYVDPIEAMQSEWQGTDDDWWRLSATISSGSGLVTDEYLHGSSPATVGTVSR